MEDRACDSVIVHSSDVRPVGPDKVNKATEAAQRRKLLVCSNLQGRLQSSAPMPRRTGPSCVGRRRVPRVWCGG